MEILQVISLTFQQANDLCCHSTIWFSPTVHTNYPTFPAEDFFAVHTFLLEKAFTEQKAVISKII